MEDGTPGTVRNIMKSLVFLVVMAGVTAATPQVFVNPIVKTAPAYPYASPAYPYSAPTYPYAPAVKPYATPYTPQYVKPIAILRQSQDVSFDGTFTYDFETENGISAQARGFLKDAGSEFEAQVIQGQYSYTAPDGTPIVTQYIADETGFHPEGAHLPVAPADPYRIA